MSKVIAEGWGGTVVPMDRLSAANLSMVWPEDFGWPQDIGWDAEHGEYRAAMADNYGHADVYHGHIEGDRLVIESMGETGPPPVHVERLGPGRHQLAKRDVGGRWIVVLHRGIPMVPTAPAAS